MFMRPREEPSVSEAEAPSLRGRVVAGVHVELLEYGGDVVVDRAGRQDESLGDVRVGQPVREQAQDLHLTGGETGRVLDHFLPRPARETLARRGPVAACA